MRLRRRGRHCPGPLGGDKVLVAHRVVGNGELEHPVEDHPAVAGAPAVEAEHELIQVTDQVRVGEFSGFTSGLQKEMRLDL